MLLRLDRALDARAPDDAACAEGPANVRMSHCEAGDCHHCVRHAGTRPRWPARDHVIRWNAGSFRFDAYCIHSAK